MMYNELLFGIVFSKRESASDEKYANSMKRTIPKYETMKSRDKLPALLFLPGWIYCSYG